MLKSHLSPQDSYSRKAHGGEFCSTVCSYVYIEMYFYIFKTDFHISKVELCGFTSVTSAVPQAGALRGMQVDHSPLKI